MSLADLLTIFKWVPEEHWNSAIATVDFMGRGPDRSQGTPSPEPSNKSTFRWHELPIDSTLHTTTPEIRERGAFWRIASILPNPEARDRPPASLADDIYDIDELRPPWRPTDHGYCRGMAPRIKSSQLVTALRRRMVRLRPTSQPDILKLVLRLAEGKPVTPCPVIRRRGWPARVDIIIDCSDALWPLTLDLLPLLHHLRGFFLNRARVLRTYGDSQSLLDFNGHDALRDESLGRGATLVLGDAGLYSRDPRARRSWCRLARRLARTEVRPLLLAPVPPRLLDSRTARDYDVALIGDEPVLRFGVRGPLSGQPPVLEGLTDAARRLRAALFGHPCVEAWHLRALRVELSQQIPLDKGHELEVWHDVAMSRAVNAITVHPDHRARVRSDFESLPASLRETVVEFNSKASLFNAQPLLRCEYAYSVFTAIKNQQDSSARLLELIDIARAEHILNTLHIAVGAHGDFAGECVHHVHSLLARVPDFGLEWNDVAAGIQLKVTEASLHREPARLPAAFPLSRLQWALPSTPQSETWFVYLYDRRPAPTGSPAGVVLHVDTAPVPGLQAPFAVVHSAGKSWSVHSTPHPVASDRAFCAALMRLLARDFRAAREFLNAVRAGLAGRALTPVDPLASVLSNSSESDAVWDRVSVELRALVDMGSASYAGYEDSPLRDLLGKHLPPTVRSAIPLSPEPLGSHHLRPDIIELSDSRHYRLEIGAERMEIEPCARPFWAHEIERRGDELTLTCDGRVLRWVPRSHRPVAGAASFELPHGCWWDEREWRSLESPLECPSWAKRHGVDEYGYWCEFQIQGCVQRLRFIIPGSCWLGSPLMEEGRAQAEELHRENLTHGFWLADTPCTRELWERVVFRGPKMFRRSDEGAQLPTDRVSWREAMQEFLPALNAQLPDLHASLPTNAQWEYACRAGRLGPYSLSAPASGSSVRCQESLLLRQSYWQSGPLPVKALAPNRWGLYQMHGNVWEWCLDGYEHFSREETVDSVRIRGGGHVARGGSYVDSLSACRAASRSPVFREPENAVGFRLMAPLRPAEA